MNTTNVRTLVQDYKVEAYLRYVRMYNNRKKNIISSIISGLIFWA